MSSGRRRRARLPLEPRGTIVLDSGALSRLAEADPVAWAVWRRLTARGWRSALPSVVLAEATTGRPDRDARANRVIRAIDGSVPCDEPLGRAAGALRFRAASSRRSTATGIDAIVAAVAQANVASIVLTTDPDDMERLLSRSPRVRVLGL